MARCSRAALLLALLLTSGCGEAGAPEGRRTSRGTAAGAVGAAADTLARSAPDSMQRTTPAARADSGWTAGIVRVDRASREPAMLRDVRVAEHDAYDRIVFDFGEDELPGYRIEYIDRPVRACGSGNVVELPGDGWLEIELTPANAHDEEGRATVTNRDFAAGLPVVQRVRLTCDFEAMVTWVAGVSSPNPFRVLELDAPSRVVVDLRH